MLELIHAAVLGVFLGGLTSSSLRRFGGATPDAGRLHALIVASLSVGLLYVGRERLMVPRTAFADRETLVAVEGIIVVALAQLLATRRLGALACERCGAWCTSSVLAQVAPAGGETLLRERLASREWQAIAADPVEPQACCELVLERCLQCKETNALSASGVTGALVTRRNGTVSAVMVDTVPWFSRVPLSREDVEALESAIRAARGARLAAAASAPPALVPVPAPLTPEQEAHRARLNAFADTLRERERERSRVEDAARDEIVPNDAGVVHGPTRAEIIVAALRAVALAPILVLPAACLLVLLEVFLGAAVRTDMRMVVSVYGTTVALAFLIPVLEKLGARHLRLVRARVFEKGSIEPYFAIAAIGLYAVCALAVAAGVLG